MQLKEMTDRSAFLVAGDALLRAKKDWYELIKRKAKDSEYNEIRAFFKSEVCKLYYTVANLYRKIHTGEWYEDINYIIQQTLKALEEDKIKGIVREVSDEIL